ncbi:hypothetical protein Tco_0013604 [Tanacetum coccineum]
MINSSSDDDYPYGENIDYVDASPPDVEIVSLEVVEFVDPKVGRIDDDILLTIKDDYFVKKLIECQSFLCKIDSLRDNSTPSSKLIPFGGDLTSIDLGIVRMLSGTTKCDIVPLGRTNLLSSLRLYGSFVLFITYPLSSISDLHPGMKIPFLILGHLIYHSFMPRMYLIGSGIFHDFNVSSKPLENESQIEILISRMVKTLVLAVFHKSFTSSASFWESRRSFHEFDLAFDFLGVENMK